MSKNLPVVSNGSAHQLTRAEQKSAILTYSQLQAMRQELIKAHFAGQALEDISTSRMEHLDAGASAIWDIKGRPGRPADEQLIIDQAADSITLRLDSYLLKSTDIAAAQIIGIQSASTYIEPQWKPQGMLRRRLRDE